MQLIEELKRRNVIRVGVLYLVAAWLLLQLTDVLSSLLPVPESAGSLVILLLILGFFPVLIFSWVYEMTPEGLKREVDVDRSQPLTPDTGKRIDTLIVVLLVVAIAGLVADRLMPQATVATDFVAADPLDAPLAADGPSIAVLPFADLSQDQDQQYFTDGLSEELLNLLVHVEELEGSVRKDGDRIRITAQLIDAGSDRHVWSENFDREFVDIFAIQDEIANAIVRALTGELGMSGEKAVTVEAATENLDAYEMYLTARELFINRERLPESIRLFRGAVELDPDFARAWAGLSAVEAIANEYIFDDGIDHFPLAREAAETAISLNPDMSLALATLGSLASDVEGDILSSLNYYDAAIEKDSKNTSAWLWRGIDLHNAGFLDEALEHMFYANSEAFVSTYVRSGHRNLALLIADLSLGSDGAPVIEWISSAV